eukprot:g39701.t1
MNNGQRFLHSSRRMVPRLMGAAALLPTWRSASSSGANAGQTLSLQFSASKTDGAYVLGISASGFGKRQFRSILAQPLPELAQAGLDRHRVCGEDALVVQPLAGGVLVAVADGVGGWASMGVDAGVVSHRLLELVAQSAQSSGSKRNGNQHARYPLQWLQEGYEQLQREGANDANIVGSTTCAIGLVSVEGAEGEKLVLSTVNVGDSGCVVVRQGRVIWQVQVTQHGTGRYVAPFQLAVIPDRFREPGLCQDLPEDGAKETFVLQPGDTLIFASDGLLDNLSVPDRTGAPTTDFSPIAQEVAAQLEKSSNDDGRDEEERARKEARRIVEGLIRRALARYFPKIDDVSVVCVRVRSRL